MKLLTLDYNQEYLKTFENEEKNALYKRLSEIIEKSHSISDIYYYINPYLIKLIDINDIITFLYSHLPINNFDTFKCVLKSYLEEKLNNAGNYTLYKTIKMNMLGFYNSYKRYKDNIKVKTIMGNETVYKYLTINWVGRQAESSEFDNKKYIFNLCYEKIDEEETLRFWRLNEENKWERLTFVRNNMNEQDILDPDFELDHFYKWTSDNPGDNISKGKSTIYYFDI